MGYTTNTSDKSKRTALILLFCGGIGLHLFYVGRMKAGFIRLLLGLCCWGGFYACVSEPQIGIGPAFCMLLLLLIFNIVDIVKILLGSFRDNVGNPLRH